MDLLTRFAELAEDWQYYIRRVGLPPLPSGKHRYAVSELNGS